MKARVQLYREVAFPEGDPGSDLRRTVEARYDGSDGGAADASEHCADKWGMAATSRYLDEPPTSIPR